MIYLVATTALAFALNAEPAPKPYGPAVDGQAVPVRITSTQEDTPAATRHTELASPRDDDRNRAYACVDDDCKVATPVYNTRTPIEAENRPFRSSW